MRFKIKAGTISVSDDRSVGSPTMFGPSGEKLRMKYDHASCFNDWERRYTWAFEAPPVEEGQVFVFVSVGHEEACVVRGGALVPCACPEVIRDGRGAPLRLAGTPAPPLTILIATMDRRDLLELTLWYIYETSDDSERDIWIWDNGSVDDTPQFLGMMAKWPGVRCFRSEKNLGLAGPRKRMIPHVKTPYIFTLDDDMWPLNRGWAGGVARVLEADPSIYQLALSITGHWHNNYGVVHTTLDRPFFRVPYMQPGPRAESWGDVPGAASPAGSEVLSLAGESVIVSTGDKMPFAVSGSASAWCTADVLPLCAREERHPVVDLSEAWGHVIKEQQPGRRDATICNYSVVSPCPGPLWHLGRGERYWGVKCDIAPAIYGRPSEEQRGWLERAREASGWGAPLENPDVALR